MDRPLSNSSTPSSLVPQTLRSAFARHVGLIVPACVIGAVLVVVAPLPPLLMDLLLAANITLSVVILLTTTQVTNPLQFSVFPSLLLGTTLARLVLNIATTRLILTRAADYGTSAAGGVIAAFGDFVTAGSAAVGLILFLILVAVQFLVITRGATRISEVAARFSLDGLPGRQMSIDADLASGALSAEQAQDQRRQLVQQADFYGAMDGASRFVRGDAIAGLVITLVNIIGGLAIGVLQHGMSITDAAGVFATLTIGDGLVSQLPAFLIAIAAGLLVTRSSLNSNLSQDAVQQTFAYPLVLYVATGLLSLLAFTGLPMIPLLCLALACATIGFVLTGDSTAAGPQPQPVAPLATPATDTPAPTRLFVPGETEPLVVELGLGLIALARQTGENSLVQQLGRLRQRLAMDLGFVIPKSRIRDNLLLDFYEFQITLDGLTVAAGKVDDPDSAIPSVLQQAEAAIRRHAHMLLSRPQVHQLLDHIRQESPRLLDEVTPDPLKIGQVHQVLTSLLREQVPIRNLAAILGALADAAHETRDIRQLTDAVRGRLGRLICSQHCRADGTLPAIVLDPMFEASLADGLAECPVELFTSELGRVLSHVGHIGHRPVLVCRADLRSRLQECLHPEYPELCVLSRSEVTADVAIDVIAEFGQSLLVSSAAA